jgi:hypothetical protein
MTQQPPTSVTDHGSVKVYHRPGYMLKNNNGNGHLGALIIACDDDNILELLRRVNAMASGEAVRIYDILLALSEKSVQFTMYLVGVTATPCVDRLPVLLPGPVKVKCTIFRFFPSRLHEKEFEAWNERVSVRRSLAAMGIRGNAHTLECLQQEYKRSFIHDVANAANDRNELTAVYTKAAKFVGIDVTGVELDSLRSNVDAAIEI